MTTSADGAQGPSEQDVATRLAEAAKSADEGHRLAAEVGARFEAAKAASLRRQHARLTHKYGSGSPQARAAEAAARVQEHVRDASVAEMQRARVPATAPDAETIRVHGRAVDRRDRGVAEIEARLVGAQGKASAKATTDENGYFRLDVKARVKPGPAKAGGRRIVTPAEASESAGEEAAGAAPAPTWELVLLRGQKELLREEIRDLEPGQSLYLEPLVERQ